MHLFIYTCKQLITNRLIQCVLHCFNSLYWWKKPWTLCWALKENTLSVINSRIYGDKSRFQGLCCINISICMVYILLVFWSFHFLLLMIAWSAISAVRQGYIYLFAFFANTKLSSFKVKCLYNYTSDSYPKILIDVSAYSVLKLRGDSVKQDKTAKNIQDSLY